MATKYLNSAVVYECLEQDAELEQVVLFLPKYWLGHPDIINSHCLKNSFLDQSIQKNI